MSPDKHTTFVHNTNDKLLEDAATPSPVCWLAPRPRLLLLFLLHQGKTTWTRHATACCPRFDKTATARDLSQTKSTGEQMPTWSPMCCSAAQRSSQLFVGLHNNYKSMFRCTFI